MLRQKKEEERLLHIENPYPNYIRFMGILETFAYLAQQYVGLIPYYLHRLHKYCFHHIYITGVLSILLLPLNK